MDWIRDGYPFGRTQGLPARGALNAAADPADREAVLARERQLLYVAMTRARDLLRVTWAGAPSPFLAPLITESP